MAESTVVSSSEKYTAIILIVDDRLENIRLLKAFLKKEPYELLTATSGEEALSVISKTPPDVILLDVVMPGMSGLEVCRHLKEDEETHHIPVIMVTGVTEREANVQALEAGADDFLTKPLDSSLLHARIENSLRSKKLRDRVRKYQKELETYNEKLEEGIQERTAQLQRTQQVTVFSLAKLSESRDEDTGVHLDRMRRYTCAIAEEMATWDRYKDTIDQVFIDQLHMSSPLHDIGKVGIPDEILLKPGKLTYEEFEIMKLHATIGGDTLHAADIEAGSNSFLTMGRDIAYCHHEKWNGAGYPKGLAGETIPLSARITALGDVYDALTTKRPYKDAFSHEKARAIIKKGKGTHFDPDVIEAFVVCEGTFLRISEELGDRGELPQLQKTLQRLNTMREESSAV
jgi:putative two-component system response regulator